MADEFFLDETRFRSVTNGIRTTGTNLGYDHQRLTDTLAQFQGCWGDDEIGKAFEKNYWANAEEVRVALAEGGPGLVETGDNVQESADYLASVDQGTAAYLDSIVPEE